MPQNTFPGKEAAEVSMELLGVCVMSTGVLKDETFWPGPCFPHTLSPIA